MTIHDQNNLMLEVEVPVAGLPNLVQNPSGDKGAWGWLTPVNNTTLSAITDPTFDALLKIKTTAAQAVYWTTEFMPLAATKWVGARFTVAAMTASVTMKPRFEFYDSTKTLLSSGAQGAATTSTVGATYFVTAVQAPASTAYVKLRFDLYNAGSTPHVNDTLSYRDAMLTWADTSAGLGSIRTNMFKNPSLETNTTNWLTESADGEDIPLTRVTGIAGSVGTYVLKLTNNLGRTIGMKAYPGYNSGATVAITGGKTYTLQARVRSAAVSRNAYWYVSWYGAAMGTMFAEGPKFVTSTSGWVTVTATLTAPSRATSLYPAIQIGGTANGEIHYVDAVLMETGKVAGGYFDGSTAATGGKTYAWTGTAHASTSTETSDLNAYDFSEPNGWRNILGPTHDIKVTRKALDVGLLSATILDPLLDPSVETSLRPGKEVRLRVLSNGKWESLFEGKVTNAQTTYLPTRVTLTASDSVAQLSNQSESRGVSTIAQLPYLLEGKGVPWSVNGSGNQIASATIVSNNENASMLDQISVARDSALGYAWVDRNNVMQVWNVANISTVSAATLNETVYSDLDVGFNTDQCINQVTVKFLRYNATKGETTEVVYGPYVDAASVDEWGPHGAEFTIQSATESSSTIATYAQSILTANSVPRVRVNKVHLPIMKDTDLGPSRALLDLYDLVTVVNAKAATNESSRITGIEHSITPDKWVMDVTFDADGAVAAPTWTPSPLPPNSGSNAPQAGSVAVSMTSLATNTATVTFAPPFLAVPTVVVNANVKEYYGSIVSVTTTTLTLRLNHRDGTVATQAGLLAYWIAIVGT